MTEIGMSPEEAFKLFAESKLFSDVCSVLLSGERTQKSEDPIAKGEIVIGELSPLEIAVFCAQGELCDEGNALKHELGKCQGPNCPICQIVQKAVILEKLFWGMVKTRLNTKAKFLGVRVGYKVVEISTE